MRAVLSLTSLLNREFVKPADPFASRHLLLCVLCIDYTLVCMSTISSDYVVRTIVAISTVCACAKCQILLGLHAILC